MTFQSVMIHLKNGKRAIRTGWNDLSGHVIYDPARDSLFLVLPNGDKEFYCPKGNELCDCEWNLLDK